MIKRSQIFWRTSCLIAAILSVFSAFLLAGSTRALATCPCPTNCTLACSSADHSAAKATITSTLQATQQAVSTGINQALQSFVNHATQPPSGGLIEFITDKFFPQSILPDLQSMAKQIGSFAAHQVAIIGSFFDAKQQLETQRLYQELSFQAHRDYQPSQDVCSFGTNVRSLSASEHNARLSSASLNEINMKRVLGHKYSAAATGIASDKAARYSQFRENYCDKHDNGWSSDKPNESGFAGICKNNSNTPEANRRKNIDIDYTRLIDAPKTIDIAFHQDDDNGVQSDILALSQNLFGHEVMPNNFDSLALLQDYNQRTYFQMRSLMAKRAVAQSSFNAIVGLKASGVFSDKNGQHPTYKFLGAALKELGMSKDEDIVKIIGENPSYYAQLEILAKTLYQSPEFFASLYDKPANVARKSVALKAIELMVDRAIYESQLRQEMSLSVLLSSQVQSRFAQQ